MKKGRMILVALIVTYILLRLFLVSSQRDNIFDYNEFISGTVAIELIHGSSLPLKYCMPDDHNFGSIVNGILIVPFYLLFGPSSASAKMVSILFSLGVLIFSYLLLNRFFNLRVAVIASLLFIFSPTIYTKSSVLSVGSHPESNIFTLIILFISYFIFFDNRKKAIYFIILGFITGFGLFYSYVCGITALVLFIFWFAFDRKFILKPQFYLFLLFFIIGFSPRFYFAEGIKPAFERALNFLHAATSWQNPFFTYSIVKTKAFFLKDLLRLFNFEHLPCIIQYIYYSLFGVSFFYLLWRSMRNIILLKNINKIMAKETPFLMFFLIFSLAYIFSCYTIWNGWECAGYLVPLYPAIFVIIAVSLDKFIRVKNRLLKISTVIFLSLILSAGFYENLGLISFHKIGRGFIWKGYSYRVFGWTVGRQFQDNDKALEIIKNIYSPERRFFLEGLGWGVAGYDNPTRETDILQENIIKRFSLNNQDRLYYYEGIGKGLAHRMNLYLHHQKGNLKIAMNILQGIMKRKEAGVMRYFWKGFGQDNEFLSDTYQMVKDYMEEQFKPYLWEGAGETAALFYLNDDSVNPPNTLLNITDFKYRKYIYSGYTGVRSELLLKDLK